MKVAIEEQVEELTLQPNATRGNCVFHHGIVLDQVTAGKHKPGDPGCKGHVAPRILSSKELDVLVPEVRVALDLATVINVELVLSRVVVHGEEGVGDKHLRGGPPSAAGS